MDYKKNKVEARGIKIDREVKELLQKGIDDAGSMRKFASATNMYPATICRWLGKTTSKPVDCIDWTSWESIWRYLSKHNIIATDDIRWMPPTVLRESLTSGKIKPAPGSDVSFDLPPLRKFPVISMAAAATVNTCYYPLAEYASLNAEDMATFSAGRDGDFVIRVHGDSMKPWYPPGTLLLLRPHLRLHDGDRVIAVLTEGEVIFKCFVEKKKTFMLVSINGDEGCNLEIAKDDFTAIRDIYKVIQSVRVEDDLDAAMREKGHVHFWAKYKDKE